MSNALQDVGTRPSEASLPSEGAALPRAADGSGARKRVVIVGAGFGGVAAARALAHSEVDVTLIDRRNHHIFQPLLYQVATAVLAPSEIAAPIRHLVGKQKNLSVLLGEATGVDLDARTVAVNCPGVGARQVPFDFLVIATGMRPSYFGHDEFARYAPGLKSLSDAETIRTKILSAYELADTTDDENERARAMTFLLVGAGPTGVELAASMAQMATLTLRGQYRRIDAAESAIILIEGGARILPTFSERLAGKAAKRLEKLGVKILGRDRLDPKAADYSAILTKIKSLNPDALYYGGVGQAGVKVVKQSYDIVPDIIKSGGDGVYGAEILTGAGFPAAQGWYATTASPNIVENPDAAPMIERFAKKYGKQPSNYSITAYDAALVILDAVKTIAASGKDVTRDAVRDAIQQSHAKTLQGEVSFDANGDIDNRVVSVFQITRNDKYPLDDVLHQYKYLGVAPASS